jgi:hypothetical protein
MRSRNIKTGKNDVPITVLAAVLTEYTQGPFISAQSNQLLLHLY